MTDEEAEEVRENMNRLVARMLLADTGSPEDRVAKYIRDVEKHVMHAVRQARFDVYRDLYIVAHPDQPEPTAFCHGGTMAFFAEEAMKSALERRLQGQTGDEEE